ncbi:DUF222 domain-containing protein [Cellulomonas persica]|uniref:DUF222 domain-containing protein n=1 Tax=Cellulomonas persica TaxID=76861 RepID=A0A510V0X8_9CELL|nr:DUF222 domain-containing protein [Cellulomonas persica]GEK18980.1 hypothetical protein CPE01_27130 [Cellulomonas persica]
MRSMLWDSGAPAATAAEGVAVVAGGSARSSTAAHSGTLGVVAPDAGAGAGVARPGDLGVGGPDTGAGPGTGAARNGGPGGGAPDVGAGSGTDVASAVASLVRLARSLLAPARASARWAGADRQSAIAGIDDAVAALIAARAHLLSAEQRAGSWAGSGDRDFAAWRGRVTRGGAPAASAEVRAAEVVTSMPAVEEGLANRTLSQRHVDVLARTAAKATPAVAAALAEPEQQLALVELGRRLDGRHFASAVDRWAAAVDPVAVERDHAAQRERRHLHVTDTPGGTQVRGLLDLRAGHRLRLALEAASPRPTTDDPRSLEQRRADALVAIAEHALSAPDSPPSASVAPHVSVVLSQDTWAALSSVLHPPRTDTSARRSPAEMLAEGLRGVTPPADEEGAPIPVSEVVRLLCDCELTRVVVDAEGRPVDVGRTQRLYSGYLRRAVIARDRGCVWSGCGARARWCEVHHIQ